MVTVMVDIDADRSDHTHTCDCDGGYDLKSDGKTCEGIIIR